MKRFLWLIVVIAAMGCHSTPQPGALLRFETSHQLADYFTWSADRVPLISAHRGGPEAGYPENCLETFEHALEYGPCLIECDVRQTRDSVLVLMHDETVDRTTTGTGRVQDLTWDQIHSLSLKDSRGRVTEYRVPRFSDVLRWARDHTVLTVDIKEGVRIADILYWVERERAEGSVILITYTLETAETVYQINPDIVLSVPARGVAGARRLLNSSLDLDRVLAFVGVFEPVPDVYHQLHSMGIWTILGTMGNLDRRAERRGPAVYQELYRNGADILSTDRVRACFKAIDSL
jgi:glycerophosphoryl diester phosphodiesterase